LENNKRTINRKRDIMNIELKNIILGYFKDNNIKREFLKEIIFIEYPIQQKIFDKNPEEVLEDIINDWDKNFEVISNSWKNNNNKNLYDILSFLYNFKNIGITKVVNERRFLIKNNYCKLRDISYIKYNSEKEILIKDIPLETIKVILEKENLLPSSIIEELKDMLKEKES